MVPIIVPTSAPIRVPVRDLIVRIIDRRPIRVLIRVPMGILIDKGNYKNPSL